MKIFSWVHRKLNQKDNGLFGGDAKKDEVTISKDENIGDKQLLQDEYSMLGGWKGVLSIGTFGFDPHFKDQLSAGLDDDEVEDHEECGIIAVSDHEEFKCPNNGQEAPIMANSSNLPLDDDESNRGRKKERITLADLFSADLADDKEKVQLPDLPDVTNNNKKSSKLPQVKNGVSFAKKIIPRVREDSRRIQKLMARALRKKIHPDMESKNQKNSPLIAATASTMLELFPITSRSISLREILETPA